MKKIGAKIIVNSITMTRVIGTFLMPFVSSKFTALELVTYIILLLITDSIDGIMARRLQVSTLFGALLDTLADKLLAIATIIILARIYPIMWSILALEIIITIINVISGTKGSNIESTMLGKAKTWILGICTVGGFITAFANDFLNIIDNTNTIGMCLINIFKSIIKHSKIIIYVLTTIAVIADIIVAINYLKKHKKEVNGFKQNGIDAKKYKIKKGNELKEALFSTDFYEETKNEPILIRLGKVEE